MTTQPKHTKEPWVWHNTDLVIVGTHNKLPVTIAQLFQTQPIADQFANAARIVACVNGCQAIADPSVVPELVEALEDLVHRAMLECGRCPNDAQADCFVATIVFATGVLARAKGEDLEIPFEARAEGGAQ